MSLTIYETAGATVGFSVNSTLVNAMRHAVDGRTGGVIEKLYYVRNADATKTYSDIQVIPVSLPADDIVSGTDGFSIKLHAGATQPTAQEWDTITPANRILLGDTTSTGTYIPFWVRIAVPRGAPIDTITTTVFRITSTEGVA